jgi:hypothetical protein
VQQNLVECPVLSIAGMQPEQMRLIQSAKRYKCKQFNEIGGERQRTSEGKFQLNFQTRSRASGKHEEYSKPRAHPVFLGRGKERECSRAVQ